MRVIRHELFVCDQSTAGKSSDVFHIVLCGTEGPQKEKQKSTILSLIYTKYWRGRMWKKKSFLQMFSRVEGSEGHPQSCPWYGPDVLAAKVTPSLRSPVQVFI